MDRLCLIDALIARLLEELPAYRGEAARFPEELPARRRLLRSLMNVRPPLPLRPDFLQLQNLLLATERAERGVVAVETLPATAADPRLVLWRGDITRLAADAIVNAANSALLGCFVPCHGCIDNAIHSAAGLELREECRRLMDAQGHPEPTGQAKLTHGYALPCRWVLHTVGPIIQGPVRPQDERLLASCYRSCLALAQQNSLASVAFCCISTGEFHFPRERAAAVAVEAVRAFLDETTDEIKVIFNVFTAEDEAVYRRLLGPDRPAEGRA